MEDETLDALTALYSTYPTSKNVDYSAFMRDFQPVESYPNYFVPQQGLLQNTPTLDTLSDLDIMQQRPQSLLDMINLYPTLENDFQRSFAVNPDTYNMNVYEPLPYDENYWKSKVAGTGGTGGSEGCFEDDEWYCYGCELFINECEYYECTEDGWIVK